MSFRELIDDVKNSHKTHDSLEDQIHILAAHHWVGTESAGPYLKKGEIEETLDEMGIDLEYNLDTGLGHLREAGVVNGFQPEEGPDWWVIRERDGEVVMGDDFEPAVDEEIRRAIKHIESLDRPSGKGHSEAVADGGTAVKTTDDDETLREVFADEVDVDPSKVESYLKSGRDRERRSKLNELVDTVEESETFKQPDSYDRIVLVPSALRTHLTENVITEYGL